MLLLALAERPGAGAPLRDRNTVATVNTEPVLGGALLAAHVCHERWPGAGHRAIQVGQGVGRAGAR